MNLEQWLQLRREGRLAAMPLGMSVAMASCGASDGDLLCRVEGWSGSGFDEVSSCGDGNGDGYEYGFGYGCDDGNFNYDENDEDSDGSNGNGNAFGNGYGFGEVFGYDFGKNIGYDCGNGRGDGDFVRYYEAECWKEGDGFTAWCPEEARRVAPGNYESDEGYQSSVIQRFSEE